MRDLPQIIDYDKDKLAYALANALIERDEAREERDKLKQLLFADAENVDAYLGVCIERDEAREALKHIGEYGTEEINAAVELRQKLATALVERDEARELAQELLDALSELVALNAEMTSDDCTYERAYYCYYKGHYDKWKLATEALAKAKEGVK